MELLLETPSLPRPESLHAQAEAALASVVDLRGAISDRVADSGRVVRLS